MQDKLIECVPNFSEGNDLAVIEKIASEIRSVPGVYLLHIDSGKSVNRTVMTFAGKPLQVVEAAFLAVKKAAELIDMRRQSGHHPRIGSTDVCPLVPLHQSTMEETIQLSRALGKRIGNELEIPVYCYAEAAFDDKRKRLEHCRKGGYELLKEQMHCTDRKPDYGPEKFNTKTGATTVGARNFLIAYNVNLDSSSLEIAQSIARSIRETAPQTCSVSNRHNGIKNVKAIGWHIPEFRGRVQVSTNIMNFNETPVYRVYEKVKQEAEKRNVLVTGSEIVGLIPEKALLDSGYFYMQQTDDCTLYNDRECIQYAVKGLGLSDLYPFDPHQKILEYVMEQVMKGNKKFVISQGY
ncbi:MAG: glutamate formimidoyltransferase [Bacteroidota bacterium]